MTTTVAPPQRPRLLVRHLGVRDYEPVWRAMQTFTLERGAETPDELWLLEHPPVFTQGLAGKAEHLLAPGEIPVVQIDRGGQVTYHGPGQWVAYTLIDLERRHLGVKDFVAALEDIVIATLAHFDVEAGRRSGAPGVYVGSDKIAALGLRVKKGRAYHGLSLNVAMDLAPFSRIRPCGLSDVGVTQLSALTPGADMKTVANQLLSEFERILGYTAEPVQSEWT